VAELFGGSVVELVGGVKVVAVVVEMLVVVMLGVAVVGVVTLGAAVVGSFGGGVYPPTVGDVLWTISE